MPALNQRVFQRDRQYSTSLCHKPIEHIALRCHRVSCAPYIRLACGRILLHASHCRTAGIAYCARRRSCVYRELRLYIDYATEPPNVSGDDRSVMLLPHPLWVIFLRSARSDARGTSAWPRKRTNDRQSRYVRFVPKADICSAASSPIRSPRRRAAAHAKLAAPHRADSNVGVGRDAGFH